MVKRSIEQVFLIHIGRITVLLALILGSIGVQAQGSSRSEGSFGAGIYVGGNATQIDGDAFAGYSKLGLAAGVRSYYFLPHNLSMSLDISYSQKGSFRKAVNTVIGREPSIKLLFDYVEVPLTLNYTDKELLTVGAGLSFNRIIRAQHFNDDLEQADPLESFNMRKTDIEGLLRAGFLFGEHFSTEFKFGYSFAYIGQVSVSNFKNNGMFNNSISLRLLYLF